MLYKPLPLRFILGLLGRNDHHLQVLVARKTNLRSPLDYPIFQLLMAFDFSQHIENKINALTARQFGRMVIHVQLDVDENIAQELRYVALKKAWGCVYPFTKEAGDYLDRVIIAVAQAKELPPLTEMPQSQEVVVPHIKFQSCYMHQYAEKLDDILKKLSSIDLCLIGGVPTMNCPHKPCAHD